MTANFIGIAVIVLVSVLWLLILRKIIVIRLASVKTVKAEVTDKYQTERVSRFPVTFAPVGFTVVFKVNDTKLSFSVSEFSYKSYKIKDRGTLKYRGNRIISFE